MIKSNRGCGLKSEIIASYPFLRNEMSKNNRATLISVKLISVALGGTRKNYPQKREPQLDLTQMHGSRESLTTYFCILNSPRIPILLCAFFEFSQLFRFRYFNKFLYRFR